MSTFKFPITDVAKVIYEIMYSSEMLEGEMPSFDDAKKEELGGYERAMEAAAMVGLYIQPKETR